MKDNKLGLGETFINGRMINLDTVNIEDLKRYIEEVKKAKETAFGSFNRIVDEIKSK